MQIAIEAAGYIVVATLLFGMVIVAILVRGYWSRPRAVAPFPRARELPSQAVAAAQAALAEVKRNVAAAGGREQQRLLMEQRRLENRVAQLERKTYEEQRDYYLTVRHLEELWKRWRDLHAQVALGKVPYDERARERLRMAEERFRTAAGQVDEEWHRASAKDGVNLEELRGQAVLSAAPSAQHDDLADELDAALGEAGLDTAEEDDPSVPLSDPLADELDLAEEVLAPEELAGSAEQGEGLHQLDFADPAIPKTGRTYLDPIFTLAGLEKKFLHALDLRGVSFTGVHFDGPHLYHKCTFARANLTGIRLPPAEREHCFVECDFRETDFSGADLSGLEFRRCNLARSKWAGAALHRVRFINCTIDGVVWEGVDLSETVMSTVTMAGHDFSSAAAPPRNYAAAQAANTPAAEAVTSGSGAVAADTPLPAIEPSPPEKGEAS